MEVVHNIFEAEPHELFPAGLGGYPVPVQRTQVPVHSRVDIDRNARVGSLGLGERGFADHPAVQLPIQGIETFAQVESVAYRGDRKSVV